MESGSLTGTSTRQVSAIWSMNLVNYMGATRAAQKCQAHPVETGFRITNLPRGWCGPEHLKLRIRIVYSVLVHKVVLSLKLIEDILSSNVGNLIGCFTAFFDHGLLIVEDSETTATHEGWDAATQYVHFDTDSLYLAVSPSVDGPVTVCVYRDECPDLTEMTQCFDGEFESAFGVIRIYDPADAISLTARVQRGMRHLRVFSNEPGWSSRVVIVIG